MNKAKPSKVPAPRQARAKIKGLTQERLAQIIGCATATVTRSERLGKYPKVVAIRRAYLAALNLSEPVAK